jgi:hypothetical protein
MPRHVVVDGSNLATEGRTMPSLKQLNDAVLAFLADHPDTVLTVVVDATFGHRIASSEVAEFDAAIENNELVCPPAGAIGRGDAFVITIAKKVNATILSNDSYQEFHGDEPWLFEDGRLIGGKPVPNVGWVFVPRTPVRGPISRKAVKATKGGHKLRETRHGHRPTPLANQPMPQPTAPPPRLRQAPAPSSAAARSDAAAASTPSAATPAPAPVPAKHEPVNDPMPFLVFVDAHPVGSMVDAVVEAYSSHGAYARAGDVRIYCPLRHMAVPAPRAARDVLKLGEVHRFEVVSYNSERRSVDVALPGIVAVAAPVAAAAGPVAAPAAASPAEAGSADAPGRRKRRGRGGAAPAEPAPGEVPAGEPVLTAAAPETSAPADVAPAVEEPAGMAPAVAAPAVAAPARAGRRGPRTTPPAPAPAEAAAPAPAAAPPAEAAKAAKAAKRVRKPVEPDAAEPAAAVAPAKRARRPKTAPEVETPAVETPAVETPAVETPAVEASGSAGPAPAARRRAPRAPRPDGPAADTPSKAPAKPGAARRRRPSA